MNKLSGLIRKPLDVADIIVTVKTAIEKMDLQRQLTSDSDTPKFPDYIIGIPTLGGFEYLPVTTILRCEGLQKCTRIVVQNRKSIISSYPIGAFRNMLYPKGFYLCHKSHLINLIHVRKYSREGFIEIKGAGTVRPYPSTPIE